MYKDALRGVGLHLMFNKRPLSEKGNDIYNTSFGRIDTRRKDVISMRLA